MGLDAVVDVLFNILVDLNAAKNVYNSSSPTAIGGGLIANEMHIQRMRSEEEASLLRMQQRRRIGNSVLYVMCLRQTIQSAIKHV